MNQESRDYNQPYSTRELSHWPHWPTSQPGPEATPPSLEEEPVPGRTDQMIEVGYDQEHGEPRRNTRKRSRQSS